MEAYYMKALEAAGRIIMENGGEVYRVEETVTRMGKAFGIFHVESFAVPSGVFISCTDEDGKKETSVIRVRREVNNLEKVNEVNCISRNVEAGSITPQKAYEQLKQLLKIKEDFRKDEILSAAIAAFGFAFLFKGSFADALLAAATAACGQLIAFLPANMQISGLSGSLVGGFIAAFLPNMLHTLWKIGSPEAIISAAIMPLVPGVAMTNAIRDTLRGDIVSGVSHAAEATLKAVLIAGGALLAYECCSLIGGKLL